MATGKDQSKAIVGNLAGFVIRWFRGVARRGYQIGFQLFPKPVLAADAIDSFVAGGLDEPGSREFGHSGIGPLVCRSRKGVLGSLFGGIKVSEESDEGGHNPAPVGPVNCF